MIKKLLGSVREYKKPSILAPIFISLEVVLECFIPLIMASLVDKIAEGGNTLGIICAYGGTLILLAMLSLLFGVLSARSASKASTGFAKNLRTDLFNKVQTFSFSNIDKFSSSSLVTRLTTDVSNVQHSYMMIIRTAVRSPLMFIFAITMSVSINAKLSLIFVVVLPILITALVLIVKTAMSKFSKVFKRYDNLNASIQENIKGMRVVKSYVREDYEIKKFNKTADSVCDEFVSAEKVVALNGPVMVFCMYLVALGLSFFGSKLIISSMQTELSIGELSTLIMYGSQVLSSLMMLSFIFVMLAMSTASAKRIVEVLNEKGTIANPKKPVYEIEDGSIEFKDVDFKYTHNSENFALSDISIKIESGQTVGIIGGTGSSKTTFVNLISRLYDATSGEVLVGGKNVKEYDLTTLRDGVAVVLQKNVLFSGTIKDNLRWGKADATDEEMIEVCKLAQAHDFIMGFPDGYDTYIEQGGTNVSGGQKQRLTIARALLKNPKVLILDDSTSAVDTKTDALVRSGLKKYLPNSTKIIIAQRIASVSDADFIIVLEDGKINAVGTHEELIASNEIYKEVYSSQNKIGGAN